MQSLILYTLLFGANSIFVKYSFSKSTIKRNRLIFCSILVMSIFAGFRYNVGTDWITYYNYFNYIGNTHSGYMEPLYNLLNIIVYEISHSFSVLCTVIMFIMQLLVYKTLFYYNDKIQKISISFGVFIFSFSLYVNSFNGMRQDLAVAIIFFSFIFLLERRYLRYILLVLFASAIHNSAIFCLFFLFFKLNSKKYGVILNYIYISLLFLSLLFGDKIILLLTKLSSNLGLYVNYEVGTGNNSYMYLIQILPMIFLLIIFGYNVLKNNNDSIILFKIYVLQIFTQSLGMYIATIDRLALYSMAFQILLYPIIHANIRNQSNRKIFLFCTCILFYTLFFIVYYILDGNGIFPYEFRFN